MGYWSVGVLASTLGLLQATAAWSASETCPIQDLQADYVSLIGLPDEAPREFRIIEQNLDSKQPAELLVAAEITCGSRGCDYVIYQQVSPGCFRRIGELSGHISLLESRQNGFRQISLRVQHGHLSKKYQSTWTFDSRKKEYREDRGSRKELGR